MFVTTLPKKLGILYDLVQVPGEAETGLSAGMFLSANSIMTHHLDALCGVNKCTRFHPCLNTCRGFSLRIRPLVSRIFFRQGTM